MFNGRKLTWLQHLSNGRLKYAHALLKGNKLHTDNFFSCVNKLHKLSSRKEGMQHHVTSLLGVFTTLHN